MSTSPRRALSSSPRAAPTRTSSAWTLSTCPTSPRSRPSPPRSAAPRPSWRPGATGSRCSASAWRRGDEIHLRPAVHRADPGRLPIQDRAQVVRPCVRLYVGLIRRGHMHQPRALDTVMTTTAVVIARMGSTRLPGKVLMPLGRCRVLHWVVKALRLAPGIDKVIVATTGHPRDDKIATWCEEYNVSCFRGPEDDVLARFAGAVRSVRGTTVAVRVTADCPFLDPEVVGAVVRLRRSSGAAYASNVDPRTWPDGLDVEAFTTEALFAAEAEATRPIDRECVTTWIARNRSRYPAEALICPLPGLEKERWVLDTENDLRFCQEIVARTHAPSWLTILDVLDEYPELRDINRHHPCNERYHEAVANEAIIKRTYARSQAQLEKAHQLIPLGTQTFSKSFIQYGRDAPLFVSHGQGGVVFDIDGNEYVDLVSALLPNVLGYRDPDVDMAIRRQLASGISFSLATELEEKLAEKLTQLIPCAEQVRFGKNGTDATTAAVRLARAHTKRDMVVICGGYHGWNDWSIAGTDRDRGVPSVLRSPLIVRVEPGKVPILAIDVAAVIVDPSMHDREFLEVLRDECDRVGAVLIFDEMLTGFRYALGGAQELYDVYPDLACFGKALANGMPLSAIVGRAEIMRLMEPPNPCVFVSGTFGGETLSLAAALATLDKLERENVIPALWATGDRLLKSVKQIHDTHGIGDAITYGGEPPFVRLKFRDQKVAEMFRREMIASGTLIIASHNVCFAHDENAIHRVLKSYEHTFATMAKTL